MNTNTADKHRNFMKLFMPLHERLERYCLALTGNKEEAKDLVSDVILQAYLKIETLRNKNKFPHYVFRIAKWMYFKKMRNNWRFQQLEKGHFNLIGDASDVIIDIDYAIVHEAILKLPKKLRQALILHKISGFSIKEISEIENCSVSAAKARVARATKKISEKFSSYKQD